METENEFLSDEELLELRREIEALEGSGGVKRIEEDEDTKQEEVSGEQLSDLLQEVTARPLNINENGSYVHVSEDNMCAWLYLSVPENKDDDYRMEDILAFLKKNNVMEGYHHSNLAAMIKKHVYEREILVAEGKPAVEGKDGYFEYKFNPKQYKTPKVLADGRVDYTSMSTLQNVKKGEAVAVYHHARAGEDGYDVQGKTLAAGKVKEIPQLRGTAVSNQEDPDVYVALKDGKIEYKNGRIDIQSVHQVSGDVTLITGRVEFYGDILITGNVEAGVVIRAGRNIEIKGTVEAVDLFAGGDIILSRGIQGGQKAKVSARGNVFADFIEHAVVSAGGNVKANTILNSRIQADGQVVLTGKKGAVIGGYTHALMGVSATEIGNAAEVRTVIHVGSERETYLNIQTAKARGAELTQKLKDITDELTKIRKQKASSKEALPLHLAARQKELENELVKVRTELEENRIDWEGMENEMKKGADAAIVVNGNIYRGTVVSLAQMQMPIEHNTCYMKFFQQRGMIESSVIAYS